MEGLFFLKAIFYLAVMAGAIVLAALADARRRQ